MTVINTFRAGYQEAILRQQREGTICAICGKTEIEHVFDSEKCCHKRNPEEKSNG